MMVMMNRIVAVVATNKNSLAIRYIFTKIASINLFRKKERTVDAIFFCINVK